MHACSGCSSDPVILDTVKEEEVEEDNLEASTPSTSVLLYPKIKNKPHLFALPPLQTPLPPINK